MTNGRINKRSALLAILCVLVMVFAVPVASAASYSKVYGQTQDKVRVRENASTNATIIDNIVKDACIYITSSKASGSNTFVQVKYRASDGSTATGWVCQSDGRNTYVKVLSADQAKSKFKVSSGNLPSKAVGTFTAAERKAKLIANVENSEEYIALICGREKWNGQIGYDESGWMDPFYVDPDGYYRIDSYMEIYYDVGDYGYSLPSSPHLERTLVFSNGEEYNIDATADEKLNITELEIELDKDATKRNQREIESQRDMVAMEKEHTEAAEKCFEQCEAWRRILGTDYEYVDGPGPAEAIRNRTDENGAETDEPYIIGFAANIRANGKLYFVYHRTWKKGNGARGLEISEIDEQTRECTLIERVE